MYCYSSHTYIQYKYIYRRTSVRTNLALSCVHFPMFGVEPRAAQPLKTGDNICPPSLSVLQSAMVRPLLPLQLLILPCLTHLPSCYDLPSLQLFFAPHPSSQSQVIQNAAALFLCSTAALSSSLSFCKKT